MRVNYDKEHYCHQCMLKFPLDIFRCTDCHQKLRTKRHNKSTWWARNKQQVKKLNHRRGEKGLVTFRVRMRRLRVKRIMKGLKPNIPLE